MMVADTVAEVLQSIKLENTFFCNSQLTAPWGVQLKQGSRAIFHIITRGYCWLKVNGQEKPQFLSTGDCVVLPHGHGHTIRDDLASPIVNWEELLFVYPERRHNTPLPLCLQSISDSTKSYKKIPIGVSATQSIATKGNFVKKLQYGGGGTLTNLITGWVQLVGHPKRKLLEVLPPVLHVKGDLVQVVPLLEATIQFMAGKAASNQSVLPILISRLADILFKQAVLGYLAELSNSQGYLQAFTDPDISQALSLIHRYPEKSWTVESMAAQVIMSCSAFTARFEQLVGEHPLQYLTNWRMYRAAQLLRQSSDGIEEIAPRVGYESELAFSQAFQRWSGVSPGSYRHYDKARDGIG